MAACIPRILAANWQLYATILALTRFWDAAISLENYRTIFSQLAICHLLIMKIETLTDKLFEYHCDSTAP